MTSSGDVLDERSVRDRVRAVVEEMAPLSTGRLDGDVSIVVDLGCDSLGVVELLVTLEEEFGLPAGTGVDDGGVETVADLENHVLEALRRARVEEFDEDA